MLTKTRFSMVLMLIAGTGGWLSSPVFAQTTGGELTQFYVWNDGEQDRKVWLSPNLMAEFNASGTPRSPTAALSLAPATRIAKRGAIALWRLDEGASVSETLTQIQAADPTRSFSPVLHDGPWTSGRMRALPGNVILMLNPVWGDAEINQWISEQGLTVVKKLNFGKNILVLQTPPGLASLQIANSLADLPGVAAAFPNWWVEVSLR